MLVVYRGRKLHSWKIGRDRDRARVWRVAGSRGACRAIYGISGRGRGLCEAWVWYM